MYLYTGEKGTPLRKILEDFNNRDFKVIYTRCLYYENDELQDELFGFCSYIDGKLEPLDGDCYSLDELYIKWEIKDDELIVWKEGYLSSEWK